MAHPLQESRSISHLGQMLKRVGIDRAVGFTVLGRGWAAVSGLVTLLLLVHYLSPVQQGYYFTFGNILALSVFIEMGLSLLLVQFASHERANLHWTPSGTLAGDSAAKARLSSLLQLSAKYYAVVATLLLVIVMPLGVLFFHAHSTSGIRWQIPWLWVALVSAATIVLLPVLSILEGCGLIAQIARLQMWQNIAGSLLLWLALISHWGLYAAPITNTVVLLCQIGWIVATKRAWLFDLLRYPTGGNQINWRGEVWPLQWKIAIACISGYFTFQLFNPILFATRGAAVAGQMGLSLAVMMTVTAISIAWVTTKVSPFGILIARRDFAALDHLFFPCLWQSWILVTVASALVWGVGAWLYAAHLPISTRFLPPLPLALLAASAVINHGVFAEAAYLRAHKQEPFFLSSLGFAVLIAFSGLLLARPFGASGMLLGYLVACALNLVLSTYIFQRKRREWHQPVLSVNSL